MSDSNDKQVFFLKNHINLGWKRREVISVLNKSDPRYIPTTINTIARALPHNHEFCVVRISQE